MDFDLSAYLGVFLDEVDEQLQVLDDEILILEGNPQNSETIQNIFRAAHTLKGSSASMGFEQMKEFTHHLENIFDQVRHGNITVTSELINIMFESIDFIKVMKGAIIDGQLESVKIDDQINKLQKVYEGTNPLVQVDDIKKQREEKPIEMTYPQLDEFQQNALIKGIELGHHVFLISLKLYEESLMKSVRAFLIYNNLKEVGEIIAATPSIEEMENEDILNGRLSFVLLTLHAKEEVYEVIHQISEIASIELKAMTGEEIQQVGEEVGVESDVGQEQEITLDEHEMKSPTKAKAKINPTVRVDVDKLEHLMNLVGELVIDQTRLVDVRGRLNDVNSKQEDDIEILDEVTNHLSRVITELQEGMMKTRMLPIEQLFNRFPRMVRDTAQKANKEIDFHMYGKETELDRTLIEEISDPIIHLLRNSIDHGIESPEERARLGKPEKGSVELRATHEENHVVISIKDDGKGIDIEKIKQSAIKKGMISEGEASKLNDKDAMFLIFKSGVSTAKAITDISGRGVGMDIVRAHIEKLNGIIDIDSTLGMGTTFTIKLPLTLAIIRSLLVKFGNKTFAIPLVNVLEIIRLNNEEIQMIKGKEVGLVRGRVLPLVRMKEKLGIHGDDSTQLQKKREFVIVVGIADKRIGIIADRTLGNQEVVIKSLGPYIGSPPYISGATIMGDGSVALILDVSSVVREQGTQDIESNEHNAKKELEDECQFVTFKLDTEEYAIEIQRAKDIVSVPHITNVVHSSDDLLGIINLRGNMLPVYDLRKRFNLKSQVRTKKSRIIVVEHKEQDIGFLVDEVTQVLKTSMSSIEKPKAENSYNHSNLIKGISKVNERIILILEFNEILRKIELPETKDQIVVSQ
ncbi:signal transduction histidine kinase CheA [Halalkalibacter wakoensis JCM 9140]|uniref:Chemotaxis protein CheA n=1 Tax=Halalkalibacter wakoensis JCM 9140 TaxID=1236970 RepID=W4Q2P6_9BACI|nr:chemotaxis protein CheW [Halalkalibacter wakoensis]GAE25983.1 signal transduction histidine kinase CheA [Halalkalibacter wakoensis JCM 9140]